MQHTEKWPDPTPVIAALQALMRQAVPCVLGGRDPATGIDCWGICYYSFHLVGIPVSPDPAEAETQFVRVAPPYQPWDVLLMTTPGLLDPRHVLLLLTETEGFHAGLHTNGIARFSLTRSGWRRLIKHGWRYKEWAACA